MKQDKLSERLFTACNMIKDDSKSIIDVGADHGLTSIYLAKKGYNVLAIENKIGPYSILSKAVSDASLDNLKCHLSDGIDYLPKDIDTCMILGMGGYTIKEILEKNKCKLKQFKYILISPQSAFNNPISFLLDNGFKNIDGKYIYEKHYYPILLFENTKENRDYLAIEYLYGTIPCKNKDKLLLEMIDNEINEDRKYDRESDALLLEFLKNQILNF